MSDTYRRGQQKAAYKRLRESSMDIIEHRSKIIFINMLQKHPGWNLSLIFHIANTRAFIVTVFQRPIEWFKEIRMKRRLRRVD